MVVLGMLDDGIISNFRGPRTAEIVGRSWGLNFAYKIGTCAIIIRMEQKPPKVELKVNPMNLM